ncbi:MAG: recombinase family protein [Planctomycetaceae bacterium]|nr:recombinase family protein [Planctomycetaceae bacterium]
MNSRRHPLLFLRSALLLWAAQSFLVSWVLAIGSADGQLQVYQVYCAARAAPARVLLPRRRSRRRRGAPELAEASANYSRYSSATQDDITIDTQQHACRDYAQRDGQPISPLLEYKDEAISGTKRDRAGLNQLLADAALGRFNRLYLYSLSRWARESVIGMPILKRLVNVYKIRVISVTEGFDTAREGWEDQAQNLLAQHERYIKELSKNAFRGQSTNCHRGFCNGDYCFGYTSVPVEGTSNGRRGRRALPRMAYAVDPVTSEWVKRIFHWFVVERRPIRWIVAELNKLGAPKDHRSGDKTQWWHSNVVRLLANRKYIGDWRWGLMKNNRDPESGDLLREERPDDETDKFRRQLPDLRLIDDETFAKAQQILAENRAKYLGGRDEDGQFVEGREAASARCDSHLLSGLVVCGGCGRRFYVGGASARYLVCPGYIQGLCTFRTQLNRALAERLILEQISTRLLADDTWLRELLSQTHAAWAHRQATLPGEIGSLRTALAETERRIAKLLDSLEGEREPDPDIRRRLAERRNERRLQREQLEAAEAKLQQQPTEPTEAWVQEKLSSLAEVLRHATPAARYALEVLIGGSLVVTEVARPGKARRYYRGVLRLTLNATIGQISFGAVADQNAEQRVEEIVIEFRDVAADGAFDAESERVWTLKQSGLRICDIARELNLSRKQVEVRLEHAAQQRSLHDVDQTPTPTDGDNPRSHDNAA